MPKKTIPELSIDSRTLYDKLAKIEIDGFIPYTELSEAITRNVQHEARGNLTTARNMARKIHGAVFGVVMNEGLKRLKDEEIVGIGMKSVKSIGRASRRAMNKLICVKDFNNMPVDVQTKHNTMLSVLGVMNVMSKPKRINAIEHKVATAQKRLPVSQTLEFFSAQV